jgi:hypothetical protein
LFKRELQEIVGQMGQVTLDDVLVVLIVVLVDVREELALVFSVKVEVVGVLVKVIVVDSSVVMLT